MGGHLRHAEVTNTLPDRPGARPNRAYSDVLISFKWRSLSLSLALLGGSLARVGKAPVICSPGPGAFAALNRRNAECAFEFLRAG